MASEDRKRRIREHLARSADGIKFTSSSTPAPAPTPAPITPPPEPIPKMESRKRDVMDHLSLSSSEFGDFSLSEEARKKRILDHVRKSQT
jgi:hypothetical protein